MRRVEVRIISEDVTAEFYKGNTSVRIEPNELLGDFGDVFVLTEDLPGVYFLMGKRINKPLKSYPGSGTDQVFVLNFNGDGVQVNSFELDVGEEFEMEHLKISRVE